MNNPTKLFRKELLAFTPYKSSSTLEQISREIGIPVEKIIKLDTGENPYMEKFQKKNLLKKLRLYVYPDPDALELRKRLGKYTGSVIENIICGNGSDELIDLIIKLFISPGDQIIINSPTFPMYEFYTKLSGGEVISISRSKDLNIDLSEIKKKITQKVKLIFVDTPGNPTGVITPIDQIEQLLKTGKIVVSDEAYFEYCNQTSLPLLKKYPNLIIARTLSKWAGLAGLRIGYLISSPQIIERVAAIKSPYNLSSASQLMGCQALDQSQAILRELAKVTSMREHFIKSINQIPGLKALPSAGAYILVWSAQALNLQQFLRKKGILVKLLNTSGLENYLRINICGKKEMDIVLQNLRSFK